MVTASPEDRIMSRIDARKYLGGISDATMWRLSKSGKLKGYRVGSLWRYYQSDLDPFLKAT